MIDRYRSLALQLRAQSPITTWTFVQRSIADQREALAFRFLRMSGVRNFDSSLYNTDDISPIFFRSQRLW